MTQEPPRIEFPCDYPIKVMGNAADDFKDMVIAVMQHHAPGLDIERVTVRHSRNGKFLSVTVYIEATGVAQLEAIHQALKATGRVHMVL